jgi:hypothetical protein
MLVKHIPQRDPHQVYVQGRPAPRCYARARVISRTTAQPHANVDGNVMLLLLSVMTAVAAFWLAYRGWRF